MKKSFDLAAHMFLIAPFILGALSDTTKFVANFSGMYLTEVPPNVPLQTTYLDLSHNRITEILQYDFRYLPMLKRLDLSHNFIVDLDFSVFELKNDLQYVDVSYNVLQNLTCASVHHLKHLKHLDLSYNKFRTMKLCKEFNFLFELKYLGLSASEIHHSDMAGIRFADLHTLFLGLENLTIYEAGSLCALQAKRIHIVLPTNANVSSCLPDAINTAKTLEISNIYCDAHCDYPTRPLTQTIKSSGLRTLIFRNITMSFVNIHDILQSAFYSSVEYLHFYVMTFVEEFEYKKFDFSNSSLKELKIEHLTNKNFIYHDTNPYNMYAEMVVENFTLLDTDVMHLICPPEYNVFRILDLSENIITDYVFQNCKSLTHLEVLSLRSNKLEDLARASAMTTDMTSLTYLDLSENILHYENGTNCYWTGTLTVLILSTNELENTVFECLPINIRTLDLQNNDITSIPKSIKDLTFLEDLNLASNRLTDLPDCSHFARLSLLNVEMNHIVSPSSEFFQKCFKVQKIYAGNNLFECNCELTGFIREGMEPPRRLSGCLESYICHSPDKVKGTLLKDFHLSNLSCNITGLVAVILAVTVTLVLLIFCLCKYFSVPWYLKMLLQWTRTKYRVRKMTAQDLERELLFHAFVSYSEHDSAWVKNYLLPKLEKDGCIRICQHERNFIPGKGIIENIIDCIERSYKSIFVLSPHFVRSEWCHYELYFAHHRLFCELSNSLILILLEPIPQYLIPARYHKLKALMARRTYLEWPKEKSKQGLFWANLRGAIEVNLPTPQEEM